VPGPDTGGLGGGGVPSGQLKDVIFKKYFAKKGGGTRISLPLGRGRAWFQRKARGNKIAFSGGGGRGRVLREVLALGETWK